jgi:hypothetical protein
MDIINTEDTIYIKRIEYICKKHELSYKEITDLIFVLLNVYKFPHYNINVGLVSINLEKLYDHSKILISINYNTRSTNIYFKGKFTCRIPIDGCLPHVINFIDTKWPNLRQTISDTKIATNDNY